jgi:hypothetical protein
MLMRLLGECKQNAAVFTVLDEEQRLLSERAAALGFETFLLNGKMDNKLRHEVIEKCNTPLRKGEKKRCMLIQLETGGAGLSLHHGEFSDVFFMSPTWTNAHLVQACGRFKRLGATAEKVRIHTFICKLERDIVKMTEEEARTAWGTENDPRLRVSTPGDYNIDEHMSLVHSRKEAMIKMYMEDLSSRLSDIVS